MNSNFAISMPVSVLLLALFLGCGGEGGAPGPAGTGGEQEPAADLAAAREQILEADRAWSATPPEVEPFLSFFAPDGYFLPPGALGVQGPDRIRPIAEDLFGMPGFVMRWTPTYADVAESGDFGFSIGLYDQRTGEEGDRVTRKGKYLTLWERQPDGTWKVRADVFNESGPLDSASGPE